MTLASPHMTRRGALGLFSSAALAASAYGVTASATTASDWTLGFQNAARRSFATANVRKIYGALPAGLSGRLYQNGPALFSRGSEQISHLFDGDGMVKAWYLGDGKASHQARFVETKKYKAEEKAGHYLYGGLGTTPEHMAPVTGPDDLNAANTSVMAVGDEVWALWEAGSAYALDGDTLETKGPVTLRSDLKNMPFSAHPRVEPDGTVWNFGQNYFGQSLMIYRLSATGQLQDAQLVKDVPSGMIHDWTMTDRHLIIMVPSMRVDFSRGGETMLESFYWDEASGQRVIVLDKDDLSVRRDYDLPAGFQFHFGNAWEEPGGDIRFSVCLVEDAEFLFNGASDVLKGVHKPSTPSRLSMIRLRPDGRAEVEQAESRYATHEFPQFDARLAGSRSRYTYTVGKSWDSRAGSSAIIRHDSDGGEMALFDYGVDTMVEEPLFVPRGAGETDGWLVHTSLNLKTGKTRLNVLDAARLGDGPVCIFELDYAIPLGFHGTWAG